MTEYHEQAHKHMKKLIALEDRIVKYKRIHQKYIDAGEDNWNPMLDDLILVTDIRRECSHNNKYPISSFQDLNRMWKQYK